MYTPTQNPFRHRLILAMLLVGLGLFGACAPGQSAQIVAITPLPDSAGQGVVSAPAATPRPSAAPQADEVSPAATPQATPTPLDVQLAEGSAAAIAAATDVVIQPTPRTRITFDERPVALTFDEFYDGYSIRQGLILSDKLVSLDGQEVVMEGYVAPPLKAEIDFFVLTRIRLEFCPFCSSTADWPNDTVLVYLDGTPLRATDKPVRLTGRLEVGPSVDAETGMVSLVRIYAERVEILG